MWNRRHTAIAAVVGLVGVGACSPADYPTEPRFEVIPDEGPVGHLFQWNVLPDLEVGTVVLAGNFLDPEWSDSATEMPNTWMVTVDLPAGTSEYKFVFNGPDGWAGNMCAEDTWGDPDNDNWVDPNADACTDGGNATIEMDAAGQHTFMYVVPDGAPDITSVNVAGNFQGWNSSATPMTETYALWLDMAPGSDYEYKFVFDGAWAGNMCNDATYGDPDNDFMVDANGTGCTDGGNATLTID